MSAIDKLIAKVAEHAEAYGFPSIAEAESDLGALRAENLRLRDCELMLRAKLRDGHLLRKVHVSDGRPHWAGIVEYRIRGHGCVPAGPDGLPLLDASARERITKELEG